MNRRNVLIGIILAAAFVLIAPLATADDVFTYSENFEKTTAELGDWTITVTDPWDKGNEFRISTDDYMGGKKSLYMYSENGYSYGKLNLTEQGFDPTADYTVSVYYKPVAITDQQGNPIRGSNHWTYVLANGGQVRVVADTLLPGGKGMELICWDNNGQMNQKALNITNIYFDNWYLMEFVVDQNHSRYEVYIDNEFIRTCPFSKSKGDDHVFVLGDNENAGQNAGEAYWDDFRINYDDVDAPEITSTKPEDGMKYGSVKELSVQTNENVRTCKYTLDNDDQKDMEKVNLRNWEADVSITDEGDHSIVFYCEDFGDNGAELTVSFSIDRTPPILQMITPQESGTYPTPLPVRFFVDKDVSAGAGGSVSYTVNNGNSFTFASLNFESVEGGYVVTDFDEVDLAEGQNNITITVTDADDISTTSEVITFMIASPSVGADIDNDNNTETANDTDADSSNGYEDFQDADNSSVAIYFIDGDGDSLTDFLIDTANDTVPDTYWDPDNGVVSGVSASDVNGDGNNDYIFDSDGDGTDDTYYDPTNDETGDYTPPATPSPPPQPPATGGGGGGSFGGGGGSARTLAKALTVSLSPGTASLSAGESAVFEFTVENIGEVSLSGIKISVTGIPSSWVSLSGGSAPLAAGTSTSGSVTITIPEDHEGGTETFSVNAVAGEGAGGSDGAILTIQGAPVPQQTGTGEGEVSEETTGGITGLVTFAKENPVALGGGLLIAVIMASILWSVRKDFLKKKKGE